MRLYGPLPGKDSRPLVCLPGLTRNGRDFHRLAVKISTDRHAPRSVITVDSRGRGGSDRDPDASRYTLPVEAGDVISVLAALGMEKADFIGTSRGGLILHLLAGMAPDLLGKLVLNDIGPVIEREGLRHIQTYLDPSPQPRSRREVVAALKLVHGEAFPALGEQDWQDMADALYREDGGMLIPDVDPAIASATRALDLTQPLPDLWPLFDLLKDKPLLLIRGENSRLLSYETAEAMQARHPGCTVVTATGQGHAPVLDKGDVFAAIAAFLAIQD